MLSIVVPCYNEEQVISETNLRLITVAKQSGLDFEIIYVDDGSGDRTCEIIRTLNLSEPRVKLLQLSRNFGHQLAVTAALEYAAGDAVVVIDADLQDPPEVVLEMIEYWKTGKWDVVYGVRSDRKGETLFKLGTATLFYRLINLLADVPIPLDTGDFRLLDRRVVLALRSMPERDRFLRGMVSWLGFRQVALPYRREPRFAGITKYSFRRMCRLALDGIISFSVVPLRLTLMVGLATSAFALLEICWMFLTNLAGHGHARSWTNLLMTVLFLGGVQLICLGIVGEYVGRIYWETKKRPLYVVQDEVGFSRDRTLNLPS